MSDETVLTPITPDEGGAAPPKVTPSVMAASAPTVKLKPVIRKPLIRKPVIGGAKPVTLKPASGTPPPPAAVPEAAVPVDEPAAAPAAEPIVAPAVPQLKSATSPISAQASLRKTGIVAEGILTPAQAQAAKTKTSRISLESAIGVAPATKSAAPMKTIRLRRPTDIPPAPSAIKPAVSPLKPANPAPAAVDTSAPTVPVAEKPAAPVAEAPVAEAPVADIPADVDAPTAATVAAPEPSTTVTQKKTLKLRRPNFKRPTVGGLRKPGATAAAPAATEATAADAPVADMDAVADIPTIADIPEIKPMPTLAASSSEDDSKTVSGAPAWLNAITLVAGIAALVVIGLCTWSLFTQAVGPEAGPNGLASFYSETDRSR